MVWCVADYTPHRKIHRSVPKVFLTLKNSILQVVFFMIKLIFVKNNPRKMENTGLEALNKEMSETHNTTLKKKEDFETLLYKCIPVIESYCDIIEEHKLKGLHIYKKSALKKLLKSITKDL